MKGGIVHLKGIEEVIHRLRAERKEPLCAYVYDLDQLRAHVAHLTASLPTQCRLFYAVKANSEAPIIKALAPHVHGYEVASPGEIEKVRAVTTEKPIIFGGPGKADVEIEAAIRLGVKLLHVESIHELRRIQHIADRLEQVAPILLRVNLRGPLPAATLKMSGAATQFGIDESDIPYAVTIARESRNVELMGFHFHSLSNNLDAESHLLVIARYITRAKAWSEEFGLDLSYLNVGGGIGINYANLQHPFDWNHFIAGLDQILRSNSTLTSTVIFECGRYITAACGYYAAEVLDIKQNHGKHYAIIRGGTHHFRLPASWQHSHPFTVIPITDWPYPFARPGTQNTPITVAGQLCTPKDVLASDTFVDSVQAGDIILFHYTGAYGWAISHHDFLSHPHPEHIFLDQGCASS
jgi:diaminopimelate decarboxylase